MIWSECQIIKWTGFYHSWVMLGFLQMTGNKKHFIKSQEGMLPTATRLVPVQLTWLGLGFCSQHHHCCPSHGPSMQHPLVSTTDSFCTWAWVIKRTQKKTQYLQPTNRYSSSALIMSLMSSMNTHPIISPLPTNPQSSHLNVQQWLSPIAWLILPDPRLLGTMVTGRSGRDKSSKNCTKDCRVFHIIVKKVLLWERRRNTNQRGTVINTTKKQWEAAVLFSAPHKCRSLLS